MTEDTWIYLTVTIVAGVFIGLCLAVYAWLPPSAAVNPTPQGRRNR